MFYAKILRMRKILKACGFILLMPCFSLGKHHESGKKHLFDFGTERSPVALGYTKISQKTMYEESKGYGWLSEPQGDFDVVKGRWNNALNRDGVIGRDSLVFCVDLPNGDYRLIVTLGDNSGDTLYQHIFVNGTMLGDSIFTPWYRIPLKSHSQIVSISDGRVLVKIVSPSNTVAIQRLELRSRLPLSGSSLLSGFDQDTLAVQQLVNSLQKRLSSDPDNVDMQNALDDAMKYLTACRYYDLGAWSSAAKLSGINFTFRMCLAADLLEQIVADDHGPLFDKALYLLAKIRYWLNKESYGELDYKGYFERLKLRYPDADLITMYLGGKVPFDMDGLEAADGTPRWAVLQREAMKRILKIIHWWVNERQIENGELGGKYGDDVEILRWWLPAILGADDATAKLGYKRLADGVWNSDLLENGFAKVVDDVEHTAELMRDTHPAMFLIAYGDPEYVERSMISMQQFDKVWTAVTPMGHRHFKSCYFSATEVLESAPVDVDVPLNARALLPGLWAAWYNRNPNLIRYFAEWADAWVADAKRMDSGKPYGVFPAAVRFSDDAIGAYSGKWYDPQLPYSYYQWQSVGHVSELHSFLVGMYPMTGNADYLEVLNDHYLMIKQTLAVGQDPENSVAGSPDWSKMILLNGGIGSSPHENPLMNVFSLSDRVTGARRYDDLVGRYGQAYNRYFITRKEHIVLNGLDSLLDVLRHNWPLFTSEVKYTDRVYVPGSDLLMGMYTGHVGSGFEYPAMVATWGNTGSDVSVFVRAGDHRSAKVSLYNQGEPRAVKMRTWQLEPGIYRLETGIDEKDDGEIRQVLTSELITLNERVNDVRLHVPASTRFAVRLEQVKSMPIGDRVPDVAISERDIVIDSLGAVHVKVHNIGNVTAKNISVELWSDKKMLANSTMDYLAAPDNLVPSYKTLVFQDIRGLDSTQLIARVSIDVPEITSLNNEATYTYKKDLVAQSFNLKNEYAETLVQLVDKLMAFQIMDDGNPDSGAIACPYDGVLHTRAAETVYPMTVAYLITKDGRYLEAAQKAGEWLIGQQQTNGSWKETPEEWTGTTTDQALMMMLAYEHLKAMCNAEEKHRWSVSIRKALDYLYETMRPEFASINYVATTTATLAQGYFMFNEPKYLRKAEELAHRTISKMDEDGFLNGEGGRSHSIKGGVDLGYSMEMSLWGLAFYARLARDTLVNSYVRKALRNHLSFIYPDGSMDNSWGIRSNKWTTYGGATSDGCQVLFSLFSEEDPIYATAAFRNLQCLRGSFTKNGLIGYGPMHDQLFDSSPCIYPTFTKAKNLAMAYESESGQSYQLLPLPTEKPGWIRHFKTINVIQACTQNFMLTVTAYNYKDYIGGAKSKYMYRPAGGAISNFWVKDHGYLQASSVTRYSRPEPMSFPEAPDVKSLTPRIAFEDSLGYFTNLYEFDAIMELDSSGADHFKIGISGELKDENWRYGGVAYKLQYAISDSSLLKTVELTYHDAKPLIQIIEPVIAYEGMTFRQLDSRTIFLETPTRSFELRAISEGLSFELDEREEPNYWAPYPALKALPFVARIHPPKLGFTKRISYEWIVLR